MMTELQIEEFSHLMRHEAEVLDTRGTDAFKTGFIPGSINIPLTGNFKDWATVLISREQPLLLVTETGKEYESANALQNTGFSNIKGFLKGGFDTWKNAGQPVDLIIDVEPDELMMDIPFDDKLVVIDVRNAVEFANGHLKDALNIPLSELADIVNVSRFEETDNLYIHCGGGTRSVIASSIFKKHGLHNLRNVVGGWAKIKEEPNAEIVKEPDLLN